MTTLELIDKAIEHCKKCRPNESGHGVTLALLNEIKEGFQSNTSSILPLEEKIESTMYDCFDEIEKFEGGTYGRGYYKDRVFNVDKAAKACAEIANKLIQSKDAEIDRLKKELEAAKEPKWISVKEWLPESGEKVLCFIESFGGQVHSNSWMMHCDQNQEWFRRSFSHWAKLPSPPTE